MPQEKPRDEALTHRSSRGDDGAFAALARRVEDGLYRFCLAQGLRRADATDALQEALLRAWLRRRTWRPHGKVRPWMMGIAMNICRETRRRHRPASGLDPELLGAATDGDPAGQAGRRDDLAALSAALAMLPPRQREAVACRFLGEMSVRETAEVMGCAEGTVKACVSAALGKLRQALEPPETRQREQE